MYKRHGILTNLVAMVLIFTMPICCCIVNSATGLEDSCCSISIQEESNNSSCYPIQVSCCNQISEGGEENPDSEPEHCNCCSMIKGTIHVPNWSPPIDLFGKSIPNSFFLDQSIFSLQKDAKVMWAHGPPKWTSHILGFSNAPPIRGTLVLEV